MERKSDGSGRRFYRSGQSGSIRAFRPVASALADIDYARMMEEAVHYVVCDRVVAESDAPFLQADTGGHDQGGTILAGAH